MINKQFLYYTDYDKFLLDVEDGKVSNNSIAFIVHGDRHIIWTQGNVFTDSETFNNYIETSDHNLDIKGIQDQIGDYFKDNDKTISDVRLDLQDEIDQINDSLDEYAKIEDVSNDYTTKSDINGRIGVVNEMFLDIDKSEPVVIKETLYQSSYVPGEYIYLLPLNIELFLEVLLIDGYSLVVLKTRKWYYKDVDQTEIVEEITEGGSGQSSYGFIIIKNPAALDENRLIPVMDYYKLVGRSQAVGGLIPREEGILRDYISAAETNGTALIFGDGDGRQWVLLVVQIGEGNKMLNRTLSPIF